MPTFPGPRAFAEWMLRDGRMPIQTDLSKTRAYPTHVETVLYRDGPWQASLVYIFPNTVIPRHRHMQVDSVELAIGGSGRVEISGAVITEVHSSRFLRIKAGAWHGGHMGPNGLIWISFQHWLNGDPGWITEDWEE